MKPARTHKTREVGDRVSFSASPTDASCRRVYTGTIVKIDPVNRYGTRICYVVDDGWGATSGVREDRCHDEGAFEIYTAGPNGIRWTDGDR